MKEQHADKTSSDMQFLEILPQSSPKLPVACKKRLKS